MHSDWSSQLECFQVFGARTSGRTFFGVRARCKTLIPHLCLRRSPIFFFFNLFYFSLGHMCARRGLERLKPSRNHHGMGRQSCEQNQKKGELGIAVPPSSSQLALSGCQTLRFNQPPLPVPVCLLKMSIFIACIGAIARCPMSMRPRGRASLCTSLRSWTRQPHFGESKSAKWFLRKTVCHGSRDDQPETRA